MAILYITEYSRAASGDYSGGIQAPLSPPVKEQTVAIGASSAQSNVFNDETRLLRVHADAGCHYLIGENPTATTASSRLITDGTEFVGVPAGQSLKIAVIQE